MVMKNATLQYQVRTIAAGLFKAQCLKLLDEVNETPTLLIVTKRGKPRGMLCGPSTETSVIAAAMEHWYKAAASASPTFSFEAAFDQPQQSPGPEKKKKKDKKRRK